MKHELLTQYKTLVDFLGETLGYDYQINLYDLENDNNHLICTSTTQSLHKPENKIPKSILKLLNSEHFSDCNYCTNLPQHRNEISVNRNSYMLIKDSSGNLQGLLCIIFDDSRFTKLHDYIISIAHPLDFVKNHSFHTIHNMDLYDLPNKQNDIPKTDTNLLNLMNNMYNDAILQSNLSSNRLNQEERLTVIKHLKEYGFFRLKGAVPYAAKKLQCSSASIYRYLEKLK